MKKHCLPTPARTVLLGMILLLSTPFSLFCQENNLPDHKRAIGISMGFVASANGYGMRYSPMLFFKNKRTIVFAGLLVQKEQGNLSGVEVKMDYALTGCSTPMSTKDQKEYACNRKLELITFITAVYNKDAYLCQNVLREEPRAKATELGQPAKNYRFESVEAYGGFGLKWRFCRGFKWTNSVGLGGYYTLNYPGEMYYNKMNFGLLCKTEVSWRLNL